MVSLGEDDGARAGSRSPRREKLWRRMGYLESMEGGLCWLVGSPGRRSLARSVLVQSLVLSVLVEMLVLVLESMVEGFLKLGPR